MHLPTRKLEDKGNYMARADDIVALVKTSLQRDDDKFIQIVKQMIANAKNAKHNTLETYINSLNK